jgi:hypothetical protein
MGLDVFTWQGFKFLLVCADLDAGVLPLSAEGLNTTAPVSQSAQYGYTTNGGVISCQVRSLDLWRFFSIFVIQ